MSITPQSALIKAPISQQTLLQRYHAIRQHSVALCKNLETEDLTVQPCDEVSPPKWHLAHCTWFFEELLLVENVPNYQRFDTSFRKLFNSYYKSAGDHWLQQHRGNLSRPSVKTVLQYRQYVDLYIEKLLSFSQLDAELIKLFELGLQHEQQHQELLLMDIKYILGANPSLPQYALSKLNIPSCTTNNTSQWFTIKEDLYEVGFNKEGFCYDNEMPRHKHYLYKTKIKTSTESNREFLKFIEAGGYEDPQYWLSLGWDWVQQNQIKHPLYWYSHEDRWHEFTLHGADTLALDAPVTHISYFEADAYARWRGLRLPTEQEIEIYLSQWHSSHPLINKNHSATTNTFHPFDTALATNQVWCWTQSHYSPYPGYKPFTGMISEYNGKFMCNQFVLRGGCVATPNNHYRSTYRNFYQPHQRWMFSGIRLVED